MVQKIMGNFIGWFVCFAISFFIADVLGWTDQGRAFVWTYFAIIAIAAIIVIIIFFLITKGATSVKFASGISLLIFVSYLISALVALLATWVATQIFNVDFFITFEIMTFGQCLSTNNNTNNNNS